MQLEITEIKWITCSQAEVYWYLHDKGSATNQQIAGGIDLARSTVSSNTYALKKAGVLQCQNCGRQKLCSLAEDPPPEYIAYIKKLESLARSAWRLRGIEPIIESRY